MGRVAKDGPIDIGTKRLAANRPARLALDSDDDGFPEPLPGGQYFPQIAHRRSHTPCKVGLRHNV